MLAALARRKPEHRRVRAATLALIAALMLSAGCARDGVPAGTIDRATFIATWVDLRRSALTATDRTLSDAERARVLSEHGVTEEELLAFADARGSDPSYMIELWSEVTARMNPPPPAPAPTDRAG